MNRLAVARLPVVKRVERVPAPDTTEKNERGIAVGESSGASNGAGVVVVVRFDVVKGTVQRDGDDPIAVPSSQDPLTPGLVAVDDKGQRALVMSARSPHGDPSLVLVDLDARSTEVLRSFDGPGWLCGGFASHADGSGVVCCEQRLGDQPRFSVVVVEPVSRSGARGAPRTVWSVAAMNQPCVPVRVTDDVIACVACATPDPLTFTGPSSLLALDLQSGAFSSLAPADGQRVRLDKSGGEAALVVDGDRETVRVVLA